MTITHITASDYPEIIARIRSAYWGHWQTVYQIRVALRHSLVLVARHGDEFLGFVRVVGDNATFSSITDFWVDEEHRGKGVGRALMEYLLAKTYVPDTICVIASRDAKGFYEKFGFVGVGGEVMKRDPGTAMEPYDIGQL